MIGSDETKIIGNWIEVNGRVVGDEACERIDKLTSGYLVQIAYHTENGGWETLFQDPNDRRFWERIYPLGHMHGGGPPSLMLLDDEDAQGKYPGFFDPIR